MLRAERIRGPVTLLDQVDSTHRVALELAAGGAPEGAVVVARRQSAGRGRRGRSWHSPAGGLWLSVVLRPEDLTGLSLAAGLACARACAKLGVEAGIHWPNDLYVGERKLGGVLADGRLEGSRVEHAVLGVGLNVNLGEADFPPELRSLATSLLLESGRETPLEEALDAVLAELDTVYCRLRREGLGSLLEEISRRCPMVGRTVEVVAPGRAPEVGAVAGIGSDGALVLVDGRRFHAAEQVSLVGPAWPLV